MHFTDLERKAGRLFKAEILYLRCWTIEFCYQRDIKPLYTKVHEENNTIERGLSVCLIYDINLQI